MDGAGSLFATFRYQSREIIFYIVHEILFDLPDIVRVLALAEPGAPEVESQHREPKAVEHLYGSMAKRLSL
jgi:hypothetical protein